MTRHLRFGSCASAIGYYGDRGAGWVDEDSEPGTGFLADVTRAWEQAASPAIERGIRTVALRLGIVLTPRGGALGRMLPVFRCGLAGRLGDGRQYWSWVTIDDAVRGVLHALRARGLQGPVNMVSPEPVTNREFTAILARLLGRPAALPVPAFALRCLLGQMGREMLLAGARVRPVRLLASGFSFQDLQLEAALRSMLAVTR